MTTLEAIQLVKATPASDVSAEQLAALQGLLDRTPSIYHLLGGRGAVEAFVRNAQAAMELCAATVVAVAEPLDTTPDHAAVSPVARFWKTCSPRRLVEVGVFALLGIVGLTVFVVLLVSISRSGGAKPVSQPQVDEAADAQHDEAPTGPENAGTAPGTFVLADEPDDAWQGWKINKAEAVRTEKVRGWDLKEPGNDRPVHHLHASGGVLTLEASALVFDGAASMRIDCVQLAASPAGTIEVFVEGKSCGTVKVPPAGANEPVLLPLALTPGQRVALNLAYTPGDANEKVEWRAAALSDERVEAVGPGGEPDAARPSLRLWVRADRGIKDGAGRGPSDAGFDGQIKIWEDQSPRRFHLASEGGAAPRLTASEPMLAGKPGVALGGAHFSHRGKPLYEKATSTTFAVFTVHGLARKERAREAAVMETSPPSIGWHTGAYHDGRGRYGHEVTFVGPTSPVTSKMLQMGTYALIAAARIGTRESFMEVNGDRRMFEPAVVRSGDTFILGGGPASPGSYGGTVAELLVFDRALSTVEIRQVGRYLQNRYGIAGGY